MNIIGDTQGLIILKSLRKQMLFYNADVKYLNVYQCIARAEYDCRGSSGLTLKFDYIILLSINGFGWTRELTKLMRNCFIMGRLAHC